MKKRNTEFSRIIAGSMTWGKWGKKFSAKEMEERMHHCLENGITTFDHADIYGGYTTEEEFGRAFADSGIRRDDIELISKCGIQYVCEKRDNKIKHYNYSGNYIVWSVEQSLKNLRTDYLDLLLLHRPSPLMDPSEIAGAVEKLRSSGKVREFGLSNFSPSQVDLVKSAVEVSANQIEFSITEFSAMHNGSLDQMIVEDITPMAWSPLGKTFREKTPQTERVQQLLMDLVVKYRVSADQLLLAWILKHPAAIHPVIGTTSPERITNAVKALDIEMELEDWFALLVASQGHKVP
ncbi:aldo/keto reductase [Sinomicrobium weinanense]|uniref:Aldo/keto reductase n=1 Tax=Sinomicrobium weinanense TaxID=2842200 RepID=A0A926JNE5_9FLAO|nr:aldo/keto reductase [Sinomicrobium weinanense]MBC9794358.1 aldo/keto reductase [Sinomicrobium weinanense]MBU3124265.1 aldo/keto reductase [Sinomicrobium weinanense]